VNVLELTVLEHSLSVADPGERADLPLALLTVVETGASARRLSSARALIRGRSDARRQACYSEFFPFIGERLRQFSISGFGVVSASARTVEENASHRTSLIPNGRNEALRCTTVPRCACASPATADCNA
jgi:hypothetical protein